MARPVVRFGTSIVEQNIINELQEGNLGLLTSLYQNNVLTNDTPLQGLHHTTLHPILHQLVSENLRHFSNITELPIPDYNYEERAQCIDFLVAQGYDLGKVRGRTTETALERAVHHTNPHLALKLIEVGSPINLDILQMADYLDKEIPYVKELIQTLRLRLEVGPELKNAVTARATRRAFSKRLINVASPAGNTLMKMIGAPTPRHPRFPVNRTRRHLQNVNTTLFNGGRRRRV